MMKTTACLVLTALVLTGCTQTHQITYQEAPAEAVTFEEAHQTLEGRHVEIELSDGRAMPSQVLIVEEDSTAWLDLMTERVRSADTPQIEVIRHNQPSRAIKQGSLFGAAAGSLLGLATGFGMLGKQKDDALLSEGGFVTRFVVGGTFLGIGGGALIGLQRGSADAYVYPDVPRNTARAGQ